LAIEDQMKRTWLLLWLLLAALFGLLGPARADEKNFTVTISESQLNLIGKALGNLPFNEVYQTIDVIRAQVNAQTKPQTSGPKPIPAPPQELQTPQVPPPLLQTPATPE
jgi:hypothetical protein